MKSKTLYRCLIALFVALLLIPVVGCGHPEEEGGKYYCPMHPDYHSDKPGDCPICGMRLVLAEKKDAEPAAARPAAPAQDAARVPTSTEGFRLAGVQTAVAERQSLSRTTRAAGVVVADETRVRHVHTKVAGYIEKLYVNYTGQQVRKGQPLLSIYSPELLATQRVCGPRRSRNGSPARPFPRCAGAVRSCSKPRASAWSFWTCRRASSAGWRARGRPSAR